MSFFENPSPSVWFVETGSPSPVTRRRKVFTSSLTSADAPTRKRMRWRSRWSLPSSSIDSIRYRKSPFMAIVSVQLFFSCAPSTVATARIAAIVPIVLFIELLPACCRALPLSR